MLKEKFTEDLIYSQFFSFEVLSYFDSITTNENYEWIVKYFNILMKDENINAKKFETHHIRPCCTFKDKECKNRKQTKKLGDSFNGNTIKLSIYNHLFAHFYLWKIFNTRDLKSAFEQMCGQQIKNLNKIELEKIAKLKEECAKFNKFKDLLECKAYYRKNNHKSIAEYNADYRLTPCFDPINKDYCTQHTLEARIYRHKELYKNITVKDCLIKDESIKNKFKEFKNNLEKERWEIIQNSNIDFQKYGWGTELSKLFGIPRNDCGIYIKRHFPEFYKTCYVKTILKKIKISS